MEIELNIYSKEHVVYEELVLAAPVIAKPS